MGQDRRECLVPRPFYRPGRRRQVSKLAFTRIPCWGFKTTRSYTNENFRSSKFQSALLKDRIFLHVFDRKRDNFQRLFFDDLTLQKLPFFK